MKAAACLVAALFLSGCQYYRVTDPATGKEYITDNWDAQRNWGGSVQFKDLKSGDMVTLPASEVKPIPADEAKIEIGR